MKQLLPILGLLLLLSVPRELTAVTSAYEYRTLATQNQLPVSAIHSVFRDSEGYLWYGTVNGLCRDDGYQLQIFRPGFLQAQDRVIGCMSEDHDGHLWLGSDNGLYWLDKADYTIRALVPERWEGERINQLLPTEEGFIVQSRTRITRTDHQGAPLKEYYRVDQEGNEIGIFGSAVYQGKVFASFNDRTLFCIDLACDSLRQIDLPVGSDWITYLDTDKQEDGLWLLDASGDVIHLEVKDEEFHFDSYPCDSPIGWWAYTLKQSPYDGIIWILNTVGLKAYRREEGKRLTMVYSSLEETPKYHMLASVWCDSLYTMVAAFDCMNYMLRPKANAFDYIPLQSLSSRVMFNAAVMAMADAGDGWWWVFQERTGLCLVHLETGRVVLYTDCPQIAPVELDKGRVIAPATEGVWVNHDTKMHVYRLTRQGVTMHLAADLDLTAQAHSEEFVTQILEDAAQRLWVGTNLGLYVFDATTLRPLASYPRFGYASTIKSDEYGHIWVATIKGQLYDFSSDTQYVRHEIGQPLSAFCIMPDGYLWMGTQLGRVFRYEPRQHIIEDFSEQIGLNGDRVNQLQDDNYGHLWVETNQRILEYNPRNDACRIFKTNDIGIPLTRFLPTSTMKDKVGQIYFGGIPGVMRFTPSNSLDRKSDVVIPHVTDVQVMKHSLCFDTLVQRQNTTHITLKPDDKDLEIFLSSLDHFNVSHVRYAYRLNGFDTEWKYMVGGENSAFYNQLGKGHYTFEAKATDCNGLWSTPVSLLEIERLPAFYESTTAYVLYCLLVLMSLAALIWWVHRSDEKKNEQMWSDSREMLAMRNYIKDNTPSAERLPESEFLELDQAFLAKVKQAVMEHLEESDFGVEELAAAVNVSKSTLSRKLKSVSGKSPLDFIRIQKMRQAQLWLQDKDRNVTEIAISLGYSDRKYFTSCFKKEFGMTPTDYRKEVLGTKIEGE